MINQKTKTGSGGIPQEYFQPLHSLIFKNSEKQISGSEETFLLMKVTGGSMAKSWHGSI